MPHANRLCDMSRRRLPLVAALVVSLALAPALSGCSVQGIVNQVSGGKVDIGGNTVPKDFPKEVPLVSGKIVTAAALGDSKARIWNVTITVPGIATFDEISAKLEAAGFASQVATGSNSDTAKSGIFLGPKYQVLLVVAKTDKTWSANYTVSNADTSSPSPTPSG
jgi:hypothetical protein